MTQHDPPEAAIRARGYFWYVLCAVAGLLMLPLVLYRNDVFFVGLALLAFGVANIVDVSRSNRSDEAPTTAPGL